MKSRLRILILSASALVALGSFADAQETKGDNAGPLPPLQATVPDGGTTIMLLGVALTAVELLRRAGLKRSPRRVTREKDGFPPEQVRCVSKLKQ